MRKTVATKINRALKKATILFISNLLVAALCAVSVNAQTLGGTGFKGDSSCGFLNVATGTGLVATTSETIDVIFTLSNAANLSNSYGLIGGQAGSAINIFIDGKVNMGPSNIASSRVAFDASNGTSEFYFKGGGLFTLGTTYHLVAETNGTYRRMWIGTGTSLAPMQNGSIDVGHETASGPNSTAAPMSVIGAFYNTSGAFNGRIDSIRVNNNSLDYVSSANMLINTANITVSNSLTSVSGSTTLLLTPTSVIPTYSYISAFGSFSGGTQSFTGDNDFQSGDSVTVGTSATKYKVLSSSNTAFSVSGVGSAISGASNQFAVSSAIRLDDTGGHAITWPNAVCASQAASPTQLSNYQLTVTQNSNGTISPSSTQVVSGSNQLFTFAPDVGYSVASISVDGSALTGSTTPTLAAAISSGYTFSNIVAAHTITATYSISTYPVTITQAAGGTITPSTASYNYGTSQIITFTPTTGYSVASITVDGVALSGSTTPTLASTISGGYSFAAISSAHTVTATFSANTLTVTYDSQGGSSIANGSTTTGASITSSPGTPTRSGYTFAGWFSSASGGSAIIFPYAHGQSSNFTLYAQWTVNAPAFTLSKSTESVTAGSALSSYTISSTGGLIASYSISPAISNGTLSFSTSTGLLSGTPSTAATTIYTITATNATSSVSRTFTLTTKGTVTYHASSSDNSAVTSGTAPIDSKLYLASDSVTAKTNSGSLALTGYTFAGWCLTNNNASPSTCSGGAIAAGGTIVSSMAGNLDLYAVWTINTFGITVTQTSNGTISPLTAIYNYGGSQTFTFSPNPGYSVSSITIDSTLLTGSTPITLATAISNGYAFSTITAAHSVTATYSANSLTITYGSQGGSSFINGSTTTGGSIASSPGSPTLMGYTFTGWFEAATGGSAISFPYLHGRTASFTLYAQWSANGLTVSYDSQLGSAITNGSTTTGASIASSPGTPTRTGYSFNGWFVAPTGGSAISFPYTHGRNSNFTLYAQWSINTFGITVSQTGNGTISPGDTTVNYGGTQAFTFTPATGYSVSSITVNGSSLTESSAITLASAIASGYTFTSISAANTITATYSINTYSIVVTQTVGGSISPSTATYNYGSSQTFIFTPETGYLVSSITIDSTSLSGSTLTTAISSGYALSTIIASHSVTANFSHIVYSVSYDANTASGSQASESYTYGSSALVLPVSTTFTKTGYNFLGWSDTSTSTVLITSYSTNSVTVFYAIWTPKIFTVTYQANGGAGSLPLSDTYTVGNAALTLPLIGSLSKIGNTFKGWSETPTGAVIGLTYTPSATISLQAIWEPIIYSVTYDKAGASSSLPTEVSHTVYQHFTVASNPTKSGSIFGGWSNGAILFSGGSTYTVSNANITLTAIWIPLYTLHYILNGSPDTPEGDRLIASGTVVNLAAAPVRHGYDFLYWSDSSTVTYPQLGTFTIVEDSTLSAIWTPKHFNVTYSLNGGSGTAPTHATVVIDEVVALASTPVRTGYTFQGWSDGVSLYAPDAEYVDRGTTLTFTASWSQNSALAISYLGGGGSGAVPLQDSLLEGESLTVASSSSLTYVGFTFTGWNYNVTTYQPGNTIAVGSSPIVLTAQWVRSFSVLYLAGGAVGTAPTRTLDHLTNSVVVVAGATSLTKSGYTFTSWSNGVIDFQPGDTFTVLSADVELTATWTIIPIVVTSPAPVPPAPARSESGAPSAPAVVTVVVVTTEVVTPVEETTSDRMEVTTAALISTVNDTSGIVVTTTVTPTDLGTTKIVALRVKIYFSLSSSTLAAKSKTTLNLITKKALKVGKRFKVKVVGFTQPTKQDPNFKILAKNRAKVVATYLQSKGIKGIYSVLSGGQAPINAPTSRYSVVTVELITG